MYYSIHNRKENVRFNCAVNEFGDKDIEISTTKGIYMSMSKEEAENLIQGLESCIQEIKEEEKKNEA